MTYAGIVAINTLVALLLWIRNRIRLHRYLLYVWLATLLTFLSQGMLQSYGNLGLAVGMMPSFLITLALVALIREATELRANATPWRFFYLVYFTTVCLSLWAGYREYSFTLTTLPFIVGAGVPMFWLLLRLINVDILKNLSMPASGLVVSAVAYQVHILDFPFLRDKPEFAAIGFVLAIVIIFSISIFSVATVLEFAVNEQRRISAELDNINEGLETRIQERTTELQENFLKLQQLQKREILQTERARIIMDMHDGIGGQLVAAMALIDAEDFDKRQIRIRLQESLDDLRIIVDATDMMEGDIGLVLGNFRQRLQKTLASGNTRLIWKVADVPLLPQIDQHNMLQLLRILQESCTNVIKYASASTVTVSTRLSGDHVILEVADDGVGIQSDQPGQGRGIENMRQRAERLAAKLEIIDSQPGVTVRLTFAVAARR